MRVILKRVTTPTHLHSSPPTPTHPHLPKIYLPPPTHEQHPLTENLPPLNPNQAWYIFGGWRWVNLFYGWVGVGGGKWR